MDSKVFSCLIGKRHENALSPRRENFHRLIAEETLTAWNAFVFSISSDKLFEIDLRVYLGSESVANLQFVWEILSRLSTNLFGSGLATEQF